MTNNTVSTSTANLAVGMSINHFKSGLLELASHVYAAPDKSNQLVYFSTPGEYFAHKCGSSSRGMRRLLKTLRSSVNAFKGLTGDNRARSLMLADKFIASSVRIGEEHALRSSSTHGFLMLNAGTYSPQTAALVATPVGNHYDISGSLFGETFSASLEVSEDAIARFAAFLSNAAAMQWQPQNGSNPHVQQGLSLSTLIQHVKEFTSQPNGDGFLLGICQALDAGQPPINGDANQEDVEWFIHRIVETAQSSNRKCMTALPTRLIAAIQRVYLTAKIVIPTKSRSPTKI